MTSQFLAPALREGDEEVEQSLRPRRLDDFVGQERVEGAARDRPRCRQGTRRRARPRSSGRPTGPREDDARDDHPRGARRRHPHRGRAGARAEGRHGGDPHGARREGRPLRRRDPPRQPRDRGDPLPGARGLPAGHHRRPGRRRADADARPSSVHARRRDHAHRAADDPAARPLRHDVPAGLLRARRARDDRAPLCGNPRRRDRGRGGRRGRRPRSWHAACREPDPAPDPRRRRGATHRSGDDRGRARGARAPRGRRGRAREDRS